MVNVIVIRGGVAAPSSVTVGENALATTGAPMTESVVTAAVPLPRLELTLPVELRKLPEVGTVTFADTIHFSFGLIVPFDNPRAFDPFVPPESVAKEATEAVPSFL